jgi:hypothetical protein
MKLNFKIEKPNTQTVRFRIDKDSNNKLIALKNFYKVNTGTLIKEMIKESYEFIKNK